MRQPTLRLLAPIGALLSLLACGAGLPALPTTVAERDVRPDPPAEVPLTPDDLLGVLSVARRAACAEVLAIAIALPAGDRDRETAWLLESGSGQERAELVAVLDVPETVRLRVLLRELARSDIRAERDAALVALARAGEVDVLPLVAAGLRTATSESSQAALATAARYLGTLAPDGALEVALGRARTPRAMAAITAAIGPEIDANGLRILCARGRAGVPALAIAVDALRRGRKLASWPSLGLTRARGRELLDESADPRSAPDLARLADRGITRFTLEQMLGGDHVFEWDPPVDPGQARRAPAFADRGRFASLLHDRAAAVMRDDRATQRFAVRDLVARLGPGSRQAAPAARALGAIRSAEALTGLAFALYEGETSALDAVSSSLATALRVAPPRAPEDPGDLRRLWAPILRALVFAAGSDHS